MNLKIFKKLKNVLYILPLLFLVPFYLGLGKENVNVDQFLWYERSQNFFNAIKTGNFAATYQKYHPGVLLMYLIKMGSATFSAITESSVDPANMSYLKFPLYNFWTKFFLVSFILILLFIAGVFIAKITKNKFLAFLFLALILVEPYFIGNVRNLHMDALVSVLILNIILSYFWALKKRRTKDFVISGVFAGLGLLTKSICISAIGLNLLMSVYFLMTQRDNRRGFLKGFISYGLSLAIIFFALFPAMWVEPISTLTRVVKEGIIKTGLEGDDNFTHFVNGVDTEDPGFSFYFLVFRYRISLFLQGTLAILGVLAMYQIKKRSKELIQKLKNNNTSCIKLLIFISIYVVGYFAIFTYSGKKTDRYFTTLIPLFAVLSSYGINYLVQTYKTQVERKALTVGVLGLFLTTIATNLSIHPYYFAYYNPFLGGLESARDEMYINQGGIGGYEIAQYLNDKDLEEDDKIGSTYYGELKHFTKYKISGFSNSKMDQYDYVILGMQKDRQFKQDRETVKVVKVFGSDYLRVSEKR